MKRRTYVCRNCRYYLEHYIKSEQSLFTIDGHCINSEIRKKYPPAKFSLRETCECWEPMQIQIEERKQSICYVLKRMQENLEEIALILKDDADREILNRRQRSCTTKNVFCELQKNDAVLP